MIFREKLEWGGEHSLPLGKVRDLSAVKLSWWAPECFWSGKDAHMLHHHKFYLYPILPFNLLITSQACLSISCSVSLRKGLLSLCLRINFYHHNKLMGFGWGQVGRTRRWFKSLGPCHPQTRPRGSCRLLASANLNHFGRVGRGTRGWKISPSLSFSLCLPLFQIKTNKFFK